MLEKYAELVINKPKVIILGLLMVVVLAGYQARDIRLDNNFAVLFSTNNADADFRQFYRDVFGPDDGLLIAVLDTQSSSIEKVVPLVEDISQRLMQDAAFSRVDSVTQTSVVWNDGDTIYLEPVMGSDISYNNSQNDALKLIRESSLGGDRLLSADKRFYVISADMDIELDTHEEVLEPSIRFRALVNESVEQSGLAIKANFAGIAYTRVAAISSMQGDLLLLAPVTTLVLACLLFYVFRSVAVVLLVQMSIGLSVLITAGAIRSFGDHINQLTIIYPVLLMVVVTANALHLLYRYFYELKRHDEWSRESANSAMRVVAATTLKSCFISALTTSIGFASLMFADMFILHSFGLYLSIGVIAGFLVVATFIPASLLLFKIEPNKNMRFGFISETHLAPIVEKSVNYVGHKARAAKISGAAFLVIAALLFFSQNINYDYSLSGMLNEQDPIAIGNDIVDQHLSGIVPIEISYQGEADEFKSPDALERIDDAAAWLVEHYSVQSPKSLASVVKELNQTVSGRYEIPKTQQEIAQLLFLAESSPDRALEQLVNQDYSHTRLRTTTQDLGGDYIVALRKQFDRYTANSGHSSGLTITMTGEAPVAYEGMNRLSEELFQSVLIAIATITLVILLAFRSPMLTLASLIPNILPIALGLFVYQLSYDVLDPLPGIAFCIAIGIAVDDTVHLISKYQELSAENGVKRIQMAVMGVIHPLINSTVILTLGFFVLLLSSFNWNQILGALGAFMIILALLCDVFLMPAVLSLIGKRRSKA